MRRRIAIAVVTILLVSAVGVAALVVLDDMGPTVTGDADSSGSGDDTAGDDGTDGSVTTATPDMTDSEATFLFDIVEMEECGDTCRDVTATLYNDGNESATDVVVETTIYTDGDQIWQGEESVGTLDADAEHTSTHRVELSYTDALKVERNDGWITIETVIRFEDGTEVFTEERQVS